MPNFQLSSAAQEDLDALLAWSAKQFGTEARSRYAALIDAALVDLLDEPERVGSSVLLTDGELVFRGFHLRYSQRGRLAEERVRSPRHVLVYRRLEDGNLLLDRVLHDAMDALRHFPER